MWIFSTAFAFIVLGIIAHKRTVDRLEEEKRIFERKLAWQHRKRRYRTRIFDKE